MNVDKIYLKDYEELALKLAKERYKIRVNSDYPCRYEFEHVLEALKQYKEANLYYNIRTGRTHFKDFILSEYSNPADIPKADELALEDIISEFLNHVFSSANVLCLYGGNIF